jgi:translation initiation factor IF-2
VLEELEHETRVDEEKRARALCSCVIAAADDEEEADEALVRAHIPYAPICVMKLIMVGHVQGFLETLLNKVDPNVTDEQVIRKVREIRVSQFPYNQCMLYAYTDGRHSAVPRCEAQRA